MKAAERRSGTRGVRRASEQPGGSVATNKVAFDKMVRIVEARMAAGRMESAVGWARIASGFAMTNPVGVLRSRGLESALDEAARRSLKPSPHTGADVHRWRRSAAPRRRRVLHVLSESSDVGGLTRMASRWIVRDTMSASSVVLTRQRGMSSSLADAAADSGGQSVDLTGVGLIERAARLRALGETADFVICHIQPNDPIPAVAFGTGYHGGAVVFLNHADHNFWLGAGNISLVADLRPLGSELTMQARGYASSHIGYLPIPVPVVDRKMTRTAAQHALGVDESSVVALSLARGVKYRDTAMSPHFSDLMSKALSQNPRLVVFVVGPTSHEAPWPQLLERFGERLRVPGPQPDPGPYLDAADIYLDTFPFSSVTSMLEASARGTVPLTLDTHRALKRLLGAANALENASERAATESDYLERLGDLVSSDALRETRGNRAREAVLTEYDVEPWLHRLELMYVQATRSPALPGHVSHGDVDEAEVRDYCESLLAVEQHAPLLWTLMTCVRDLDQRDRVPLQARIALARLLSRALGNARCSGDVMSTILIPR